MSDLFIVKAKTDYDWYLRCAKPKARKGRKVAGQVFCLDHWWKDLPEKEWDSNAAYYELLRRHPAVGVERAKHDHNVRNLEVAWIVNGTLNRFSGPRLLEILIALSPSTWQGLNVKEQEEFVLTLRKTDIGKYLPRPVGKPVIAPAKTSDKVNYYQIHSIARKFADEVQMFCEVPET